MDILEKIVEAKKKLVEKNKLLFPVKKLEGSVNFDAVPVSLSEYIQRPDKSGIIAEFKRRSPSQGDINPHASVERVTLGYMRAGASALSVLTDQEFFGGSDEDLMEARKFNYCPILRKDFIVDEYQILEAKSIGADAILLIAAVLTKEEMQSLTRFAHSFKLEVLVEVHDEGELHNCLEVGADIIGVNNRNLKTFKVDVDTSRKLAKVIPGGMLKISESGIDDTEVIHDLMGHGYKGFLMGQRFMEHGRPEEECQKFIDKLKSRENTR